MNDDLSDRDPPASNYPHIRSYAMRRGHVTQGQRRAHNELLPRYGVAYRPAQIDFPSIFARHAPVVLEIGFGMGETTAALASAHPEIDFFGCEVFTAGVGALLMKVEQHRLTNVRIVQHDAVEVVRDMIAPDTLAGVHIFFADPWPKKAASQAAPGCATFHRDARAPHRARRLPALRNRLGRLCAADARRPRWRARARQHDHWLR
jgi:hypothetical protein